MTSRKDTSWEGSAKWYDEAVGTKGLYYHEQVILPGILRLLGKLRPDRDAVLDLACGQGVLARKLTSGVRYLGVDLSASLVKAAKKDALSGQKFIRADLSVPQKFQEELFSYATCILALQNIETPLGLLRTATDHLCTGGKLLLVLNHPCFRIPRQSHWGVDPQRKVRFRRMDLYMSELNIPIQTAPSQDQKSPTTWSFHRPLSFYINALEKCGLAITHMEEWCSDKKSMGRMAPIEDRSRKEFPLFLCLVATKF